MDVCKCVSLICVQYPQGSEEGIRSPRFGVVDSCEPPCGFWELNQGPLKKQSALTAGPSF